MAFRTRNPRPRAAEAGFTLIEAVVALAVMTTVLIGVLSLLQFNSRVAKAQVNVAEMQQSLRVAQGEIVKQVRMAGRGGLPAYRPAAAGVNPGDPQYAGLLLPQGAAISVANEVAAGTKIGGADQALVLAGTDVLTLRGVFSTTFYQVGLSDGVVPGTGTGTIVVRARTSTDVPQDLEALRQAIQSGRPEALLLVGRLSDSVQAVVQLTGGQQVTIEGVPAVQLSFATTEDYSKLSPKGTYPSDLTGVSAVGILEEYRYYIREPAGGPPRLSRARLYPGTETAHGDSTNLHVDIADNVLDLQIALGIDRNATERIEDTQNAGDDWLLNADGDSPIANTADWNDPARPLYYVRISTLARTDRLDPEYVAPPIQAIEDHVYDEPAQPADEASILERRYRRRLLQTVVDLRNLS